MSHRPGRLGILWPCFNASLSAEKSPRLQRLPLRGARPIIHRVSGRCSRWGQNTKPRTDYIVFPTLLVRSPNTVSSEQYCSLTGPRCSRAGRGGGGMGMNGRDMWAELTHSTEIKGVNRILEPKVQQDGLCCDTSVNIEIYRTRLSKLPVMEGWLACTPTPDEDIS